MKFLIAFAAIWAIAAAGYVVPVAHHTYATPVVYNTHHHVLRRAVAPTTDMETTNVMPQLTTTLTGTPTGITTTGTATHGITKRGIYTPHVYTGGYTHTYPHVTAVHYRERRGIYAPTVYTHTPYHGGYVPVSTYY